MIEKKQIYSYFEYMLITFVDNLIKDSMDATLDKNHSTTLMHQIFEKIQNAIVCGDLPAGSKISEPELARIYGISRGPLREAIHRLEGQKLVERTAHVGARVVSLSSQQLTELYQIRENLEGLACRLAAQNIDKEQILSLREVLRLHSAIRTLNRARAIMCNMAMMTFITA